MNDLATQFETLLKNDLLKGFAPVLLNFLTALENNQGGQVGVLLQINALPSALAAALPNTENQVVKDSAAAAATDLTAAVAKAETPNGANGN